MNKQEATNILLNSTARRIEELRREANELEEALKRTIAPAETPAPDPTAARPAPPLAPRGVPPAQPAKPGANGNGATPAGASGARVPAGTS